MTGRCRRGRTIARVCGTAARGTVAKAPAPAASSLLHQSHVLQPPHHLPRVPEFARAAIPPAPAAAQPRDPERLRRASDHVDSGVEAFCRGAGIDPAALPADTHAALLTLAGQMLRESVLGMMETLQGRSDMKGKLRLSQTTIQPGENNPLKFSAERGRSSPETARPARHSLSRIRSRPFVTRSRTCSTTTPR